MGEPDCCSMGPMPRAVHGPDNVSSCGLGWAEWHMREAWRELMFADTEQEAKATRDPVAPARRSKAALAKAARHTLDDGTPAHSFATLMAELATIVRNTCRTPHAGPDAPTFEILTMPNAKQQRAFELLQQIRL